jgi:hypothetical protein
VALATDNDCRQLRRMRSGAFLHKSRDAGLVWLRLDCQNRHADRGRQMTRREGGLVVLNNLFPCKEAISVCRPPESPFAEGL